MCGFAGWIDKEHVGGPNTTLLRVMGDYLAARGPDDESLHERPNLHLVFRRLAINDIKGGKQPFISADGRIVAVVNGEIYNHRDLIRQYLSDVTLASRSDCEVVIHLFRKMGPEFLSKLNGIFSIAIWDETEQTLLLARDRLGVKPLYYAMSNGTLVFASELKALLVHPGVSRTMDWEAFEHVPNSHFPFARPAGRPVATGIKGVAFVEPATYIQWSAGRLRPQVKYWNPSTPDDFPDEINSIQACVERYTDLVTDSVRMQLMSEVPVGLFLSGGLDSSLIAAISSTLTPGLQAFTIVEPSISKTGDTQAAVDLANHLKIPLKMVCTDQESLRATVGLDLNMLEYFIWIMDFPLFEVEFLFKHELHRHARATNPAMKVILLGQGADEFAGGYSRIAAANWEEFTQFENGVLRFSLLSQAGIPQVYRRYVSSFISQPLADAAAGGYEAWQYLRFGDLSAYNLWHEDRMASANGMEARVPFLDHRLVDFLCSIPRPWRNELFFDKTIERRAALHFLPAEFAYRPKIPLFRVGPGFDESIFALRRCFISTSFDEYREKYLEPADSLFSRPEIELLRNQANVPRTGDVAVHLLLRCMAISIFEKVCRNILSPDFKPPRLNALSLPLTTTTVAPHIRLKVSSTSHIELSSSVRLALAYEPFPAILVIHNGVLAAQIKTPGDGDWTDFEGIVSGRNVRITQLARALRVEVEEIESLAEAFVQRGWGILVDGETQEEINHE
jgi:asparagine synthase (glutamine-hydrolysing)